MLDALVFLARAADALVLLFAAVALSAVCADTLVHGSPLAVRIVAMVASALALATLSFHLLRAIGQFNPAAATFVAIAAVYLCRRQARRAVARLVRNARTLRRRVRTLEPSSWRIGTMALAGLGCAIAVRAFLAPPLAWDTQTYHGVKAALWAQGGAIAC